MKSYKVIISGGGTGGHIFPAISIANTLKKRFPDIDILFVGDEVVERTDEDDLGQKDPSERQAQREGDDFDQVIASEFR